MTVRLDTTSFHLHDELAEPPPAKWLGYFSHLSYSSISMWRRCHRQFYRRYILGEKEPPGENLVVGQVFHRAIEYNHRPKILSYEDKPLSELIEYLGDEAMPKVLEEAGGAGEVRWDTEGDTTMAIDRARSTSERVVTAYHTGVSPRIQPVEVEQRIEWRPDPHLPVPIIGFLDTITADSRVIDTKTTGKAQKKMKPDWHLQGIIYSNAKQMPVEFHAVSKMPTPSIWTPVESGEDMLVSPNAQQAANLTRLLTQVVDQIEWMYLRYGPDEEWPATGRMADWSQRLFPCDYCGWRQGCPAWAGEA